jgi:hypothetical protein
MELVTFTLQSGVLEVVMGLEALQTRGNSLIGDTYVISMC